MEKVFLIFNTACIGDMLVTNTLVQNIKTYYSDSKVVFVCNSPFADVAKYQDGVFIENLLASTPASVIYGTQTTSKKDV